MNIILFFYLFIASVMDIHRRQVPNWYIAAGFLLGGIGRGYEFFILRKAALQSIDDSLFYLLYDLFFMILFLLRIVGAADVKILCVITLFLDRQKLIRGLLCTAIYAVIFAIITIIYQLKRKIQGNEVSHQMPLVPAIMLGMLTGKI